jgi:hypothetical protein
LIACIDTIDQGTKQGGLDADGVADLVSESLAWYISVLDRGEHGAKEEHHAIRILMMFTATVLDQF